MNKGILIGGAVAIGVVLLIASDILTVTTRGCSLPFDLVEDRFHRPLLNRVEVSVKNVNTSNF